MKLVSFRIRKYKRIEDTGIIEVKNLMTFVGKNESGKSSIFTALAKLNSSSGLLFHKLHDIPHGEFTDLEEKKFYPILAKFELEKNDIEIKNLPKTFVIGRDYDNTLKVAKNYESFIEEESQEEVVETEDIEVPDNNEVLETEKEDNSIDIKSLTEHLPHFIYVEDYETLEGRFDIPEFLKELEQKKQKREMRIKKCVFDYVGLKPELFKEFIDEKIELTDDEKDELVSKRKFHANNASRRMTKMFNEWWLDEEDEYYHFEYRPDGRYLKIWISDKYDEDGVDIELRSKGFQYFFGFLLIYSVENDRYKKNTILLLDEPGLYFHGNLQLKFIDFFKKLSIKNQLFYTTHSPFLVDKNNYGGVKIVYIDKNNGKTKIVNEGAISLDEDAIFPLKVNWYTSQYQKYIRDKPHIVFEGPLDVIIFEKINELFQKENNSCFLDSVIFVAAEGKSISPVVSVLLTNNLEIIYFFDGDTAGKKHEKKCKNFNLKGYTTHKYLKKESTMEDLFPKQKLLDAFHNAFEIETKDELKPTENEPIISEIKKFLEEKKIIAKDEPFKPRIISQLILDIEKDPTEILKIFEPIFTDFKKLIQDQKKPFNGIGWNNEKFFESGSGYGILIPNKKDTELHFSEDWSSIFLKFENNQQKVMVDMNKNSFSKNGCLLKNKEIGLWLKNNGHDKWSDIPPKIQLYPLGDRIFQVELVK